MTDKKLDWLDASIVQPPRQSNLTYSEHVMLKFDDGFVVYGYAIYQQNKFIRWSATAKIIEWAYYN
jgi:hypothetical protein